MNACELFVPWPVHFLAALITVPGNMAFCTPPAWCMIFTACTYSPLMIDNQLMLLIKSGVAVRSNTETIRAEGKGMVYLTLITDGVVWVA